MVLGIADGMFLIDPLTTDDPHEPKSDQKLQKEDTNLEEDEKEQISLAEKANDPETVTEGTPMNHEQQGDVKENNEDLNELKCDWREKDLSVHRCSSNDWEMLHMIKDLNAWMWCIGINLAMSGWTFFVINFVS